MYRYSGNSIKNIQTTSAILQQLAARVMPRSKFDFGVLDKGGLRTAEVQNEIFRKGHSKCDGYIKKSYHQSGLAIDFVPYIHGRYTWNNKQAFLHIAKIAFEEIEDIFTEDYYLHWGGFWGAKDLNDDEVLNMSDRIGWDMAHFELRKKPQNKPFTRIEEYKL